ncbi:MAG TPA: hypothetical protein VH985_16525 [Candidatus Binatia bacterium]
MKIIRTIADLVPSKLGDFAPWREEFPTPSASSGVSETHHANDSHSVTPECFSPGSRIRIGLDSRLKHAGMTDFGKRSKLRGMNPKRFKRGVEEVKNERRMA